MPKPKHTKRVSVLVTVQFEVDALEDHDEIANACAEDIKEVFKVDDIFDTAFGTAAAAKGRATYLGYTVKPTPRWW
jgi:hypothetical protein